MQARAGTRTRAEAGPSTHHPQTEVRLGPLSLRMTAVKDGTKHPAERTGQRMTSQTTVLIIDMSILVGIFLLGFLAKIFHGTAVSTMHITNAVVGKHRGEHPSVAKGQVYFDVLLARLKSCPFKTDTDVNHQQLTSWAKGPGSQ